MVKELAGEFSARGFRFAVIVSRFNSLVTERLLAGALDALRRCGANLDEDVLVVRVPGSWELPVVARKLAKTRQFNAIVCLSVVIRGQTPHFEYVAGEAARGLAEVAREELIPVSFGVLTCDNLEQALDRAGAKAGNKGFDAAMAAIEMAHLFHQLDQTSAQET